MLNQRGGERGLAGAGRTGDTDTMGASEACVDRAHELEVAFTPVLDKRDRACECGPLTGFEIRPELVFHDRDYILQRRGRKPRACRIGFSSKWVGRKNTIRNMTRATMRPSASSQ